MNVRVIETKQNSSRLKISLVEEKVLRLAKKVVL